MKSIYVIQVVKCNLGSEVRGHIFYPDLKSAQEKLKELHSIYKGRYGVDFVGDITTEFRYGTFSVIEFGTGMKNFSIVRLDSVD